jgi:hypothetical protein
VKHAPNTAFNNVDLYCFYKRKGLSSGEALKKLVMLDQEFFKESSPSAIPNSTILPEKTSHRLLHLGLKPQAHSENPFQRVELIVNCAFPTGFSWFQL